MRRFAGTLILLLAVAAAPSRAAEGDQLDADSRMFAVMAAINTVGYDDGVGARGDSPIRQAVRQHLASFDGPTRILLQNAYDQYRLRNSDDNLSQFVSYALLCDPAPSLELYADLPTDLPPDVRPVRNFGPVLAAFYQEADLEELWNELQPAYEQELDRYQAALAPMLFRTAGYLRILRQSPEFRGFKVWVDLLGAPGSLNTRLYDGNVQVVVHPSEEIKLKEIRHAFLIHLLDRLSIRFRETVADKQVLSRFALFAPALDEAYKENFELLVTKSLVKAVEARLDHGGSADGAAVANRAMREGYILAPYFFEALALYEADVLNINRYYEQMVGEINVRKEAARLQPVTFLQPSDVESQQRVEPRRPQLSALDKKLQQAEFLLREELLEESREAFLDAVSLADDGRSAQAEYGLGRVAAQEGEAELAIEHFLAASSIADEYPHIRAMSHIYVARISDIMGERENAIEHYNLAKAAGDNAPRTQELIAQGLDQQFQSPRQQQEAEEEEDDDALWDDPLP